MCYCMFGALGTLQILVGLFNIGLGPGRISTRPGDLTDLGAAYWLGAVFIMSGIASMLPLCVSYSRGSSCTIIISMILNIVSAVLAIVAIVLYYFDLSDSSFQWMCDISLLSLHISNDNCSQLASIAQVMLADMDITLIVMAGIQLCSSIIMTVYGGFEFFIRATKKGVNDVEIQQPLLKNILLSSSDA